MPVVMPLAGQAWEPADRLGGQRFDRELADRLGGQRFDRDGDELAREGLFVDLAGWASHFLACRPRVG
jgi:hypothetical protein